MNEINNRLLKDFKEWLLEFNSLKDCCYISKGEHDQKFCDKDLQWFRNHPNDPYVEKLSMYGTDYKLYRGAHSPNYDQLAAHLISRRSSTIFTINSHTSALLMLADLDNKDGQAAIDEGAIYFRDKYLGGRGIIQESTGGSGRHIYFILVVEYASTSQIYEAMKKYATLIKRDEKWKEFGIGLDNVFYGLPTWWTGQKGSETVFMRGNELRLPYLDGAADLMAFRNLKPLALDSLSRFLSASSPAAALPSIPKNYLGMTSHSEAENALPIPSPVPVIPRSSLGIEGGAEGRDGIQTMNAENVVALLVPASTQFMV